ncbi:MAG: hypothetical protein AVDCRST_MAG27-2484, partial [uncultured Craurococcus sp.]
GQDDHHDQAPRRHDPRRVRAL